MNQYVRRIKALEVRKNERQKTPVVIAVLTEAGEYLYQGVSYSRKVFNTLMEKARPAAIIINDIPRLQNERVKDYADKNN